MICFISWMGQIILSSFNNSISGHILVRKISRKNTTNFLCISLRTHILVGRISIKNTINFLWFSIRTPAVHGSMAASSHLLPFNNTQTLLSIVQNHNDTQLSFKISLSGLSSFYAIYLVICSNHTAFPSQRMTNGQSQDSVMHHPLATFPQISYWRQWGLEIEFNNNGEYH